MSPVRASTDNSPSSSHPHAQTDEGSRHQATESLKGEECTSFFRRNILQRDIALHSLSPSSCSATTLHAQQTTLAVAPTSAPLQTASASPTLDLSIPPYISTSSSADPDQAAAPQAQSQSSEASAQADLAHSRHPSQLPRRQCRRQASAPDRQTEVHHRLPRFLRLLRHLRSRSPRRLRPRTQRRPRVRHWRPRLRSLPLACRSRPDHRELPGRRHRSPPSPTRTTATTPSAAAASGSAPATRSPASSSPGTMPAMKPSTPAKS